MSESDKSLPSDNVLPIEIDCQAVKTMFDTQEPFFLLDCREQVEYETAKIEGATLMPMSQLKDRIAELEPHRETRIVVHCHLGGRSLQVTQWLRELGYHQAQNMTGGIEAWSVQIDKDVPRY